ncbi:uncharacterized protein PAC_09352 [Phialocephala subalpina]|uniref:lytic cellulose monooxygenase (C4-dehydrogenating) n=1 Tax=Phialocephala subalpina TaxID=576137 RepID=A0A1L7X348_9HELO|nr:uncharacterized protein PAC_09352 [Phialocephala subalpina]
MKGSAGTATAAAGGTLGFVADQGVDHPGPVQFYMAKVPDGTTIDAWDGSGKVWFKVAYLGPPTIRKNVSFKVPKNIPSGDHPFFLQLLMNNSSLQIHFQFKLIFAKMQYTKLYLFLEGIASTTSALAIPSIENTVAIRAEEAYTGPGGVSILNRDVDAYTGPGGVSILNREVESDASTGPGGVSILNIEEASTEAYTGPGGVSILNRK